MCIRDRIGINFSTLSGLGTGNDSYESLTLSVKGRVNPLLARNVSRTVILWKKTQKLLVTTNILEDQCLTTYVVAI